MSSQPQKPEPDPKPKARPVGTDGTVFKCPICKAILPGTQVSTFPFCSERCKLLDLNNWLSGRYTVSRPIDPTDELEDLPTIRPPQAPPTDPA